MKFSFLTILLALALALAPRAAAQTKTVERTATSQSTTTKTAPTQSATRVEKRVEAQGEAAASAGEDFAVERRADAARDVVVSLCVASGDVVVRGWDRAEVRARVGEEGGLRLDAGGGQPARRVAVVVSPNKRAEAFAGGCGSTSTLELMIPRGASLNLQARSGNVEVSDVSDVNVQAVSGDIEVRRAARLIEVSSLSGDISLTDSAGPVRLTAISGNVEVRGARSLSQGDAFEAKSTSGDVTLEGVTHSRVGGSTVSGSVIYTGALARGGVYDLRTTSGDVTMALPADSSFTVHARVVVSGDIITDFPVRTSTSAPSAPRAGPPEAPAGTPPEPPDVKGAYKIKPPKVKPPKEPTQARLDGTVGTGDAVVTLSSFSGSVHLRRQ